MKRFDKTGCPASIPLTDLVDNRWSGADWDGAVTRKPYSTDYLRQQLDVLGEYLAKYGDAIGKDNAELVADAKSKIVA